MAKPVNCCICKKRKLIVEMVKIKTPTGESYACPHHPGIEKVKVGSTIN